MRPKTNTGILEQIFLDYKKNVLFELRGKVKLPQKLKRNNKASKIKLWDGF